MRRDTQHLETRSLEYLNLMSALLKGAYHIPPLAVCVTTN